jgi:DNA primase
VYRGTRQEPTSIYSSEQIKRVLRESGIEIESEVDSDYLIFCPYHNNYRTPAGEVSKDRGTFFCFSCHESRSLIDLVMHTTKKSYFEASRLVDSAKTEIDIVSGIGFLLKPKIEYSAYDEVQIKRLNNQALESPRAVWYFESRRINTDSMAKFSLGYSDKQDMITVPIQSPDGRMFLGFVARSIEGKDFKNTPGLPKSKVLFNLHRAKRHDEVYVVESSFDAIRLDQCGLAAVATLGSSISKLQIELLTKSFNSVIVIPDNDDAGKNMADKIIDKMGPRAVAFGLPDRFKDIGDMTDADINKLNIKTSDPLLAMYK